MYVSDPALSPQDLQRPMGMAGLSNNNHNSNPVVATKLALSPGQLGTLPAAASSSVDFVRIMQHQQQRQHMLLMQNQLFQRQPLPGARMPAPKMPEGMWDSHQYSVFVWIYSIHACKNWYFIDLNVIDWFWFYGWTSWSSWTSTNLY